VGWRTSSTRSVRTPRRRSSTCTRSRCPSLASSAFTAPDARILPGPARRQCDYRQLCEPAATAAPLYVKGSDFRSPTHTHAPHPTLGARKTTVSPNRGAGRAGGYYNNNNRGWGGSGFRGGFRGGYYGQGGGGGGGYYAQPRGGPYRGGGGGGPGPYYGRRSPPRGRSPSPRGRRRSRSPPPRRRSPSRSRSVSSRSRSRSPVRRSRSQSRSKSRSRSPGNRTGDRRVSSPPPK
jgi:hypothetical protein